MAIQFPNSAVVGQSFLADNGIEYVYDGNKWVGYGTSIPVTDHLQSGNVEVHLFSNGSVTFPSPNPVIFTMTFDRKNYVETQVKPRLSLTDDPWVLHGEYQYNSIGESELLVDSIFPTLINPGYTSGDAFTFDQTVHGIPGHILTIVLNDVAEPAGAGWTANIAASQPPEYPSSIKSQGAIKITSNDKSLIFGTSGNLKFPQGTLLGYSDPGGFIIDGATDKDIAIYTYNGANAHGWTFGTDGNLVLPVNGYILNSDMSVYGGGLENFNTGNYMFNNDVLDMPTTARLNSGGVGVTGSAEIGTDVTFYSGQQPGADVRHSEIYMGSGAGEFRSIYDNSSGIQNSLTYSGVEDVYAPAFSGVVSQTPDVFSQYTIALDNQNNIIIGAAQQEGTLYSNDWATGLGTLNAGYQINGIFANTTQTQINGGTATTKMNLSDAGLMISTADGIDWAFGTDGVTTFPTGGRISSTGKGGTIIDGGNGSPISLTNYYANGNYSSCVTGYSNGKLYITTYNDGGDNPSREWAFDNYGNLTLPPNGYILNSDLTVYGGVGGAGGVGATGPTGASITGPTGPVGPTGSGSSLPVNQTGWPTILTSSSDGQSVGWSQNSGLSFNGYSVFMSGAECSLNFQQSGSLFAQMIVNANVYNPQSIGNVKITSNKFSGPHDWTFGTDGNLTLPAGGEIHSAAGIGNVYINSNDGDNSHTWTFSKNGNLVLPANSYVLNSDLSVYGVSDYGKTVYTGWFQNANTVVTLDNITSRITAEGIMQVGTVYSENQITGTAWAWNGIRNKNTTFSSFSVGGTNWVLPGDWLNISETPLDNNFEVATVTVFGLGDGHLYRITYVGSTNGKWSVVAERIA